MAHAGRLGERSLNRLQERLFGDHDLGARVLQLVGDLIGRQRLIQRERRRAEAHRGRISEMEFGPIGQHEREHVAPLKTEVAEAERDTVDLLRVLAPGDLPLATPGPDGHPIGMQPGGVGEGFRNRGRVQTLLRVDSRALHRLLLVECSREHNSGLRPPQSSGLADRSAPHICGSIWCRIPRL
jgi:hypothetical protein